MNQVQAPEGTNPADGAPPVAHQPAAPAVETDPAGAATPTEDDGDGERYVSELEAAITSILPQQWTHYRRERGQVKDPVPGVRDFADLIEARWCTPDGMWQLMWHECPHAGTPVFNTRVVGPATEVDRSDLTAAETLAVLQILGVFPKSAD